MACAVKTIYLDAVGRLYFRNNKSGSAKHLRCFPRCSGGQHRSTGFCGEPVKVLLYTEGPVDARRRRRRSRCRRTAGRPARAACRISRGSRALSGPRRWARRPAPKHRQVPRRTWGRRNRGRPWRRNKMYRQQLRQCVQKNTPVWCFVPWISAPKFHNMS